MTCQKILQLYGYKCREDFRQNFNKKMSGGVKQNGAVNNLIWRANQNNFRINRTSNISSNGFGIKNCNTYPVRIYGSLVNGININKSLQRT